MTQNLPDGSQVESLINDISNIDRDRIDALKKINRPKGHERVTDDT